MSGMVLLETIKGILFPFSCTRSADETVMGRGGSRYKLPRPGGSEGGPTVLDICIYR